MEHRIVIRHNYHQSAFDRIAGAAWTALRSARLRSPLAFIGTALLIVATAWSIDERRLAALDGELMDLRGRVHDSEAAATRANRLTSAAVRLRAIDERVAAARRDVVGATNAVARIGNDLPAQTWLTSLASTPSGEWTIGGRSTRVDEIGTMLRRVQGIDRNATARLVSIAATGRAGRIMDFVIGWDRHS
jgi:Tfp pilus assembly protein PilN